MFKTTTAKGNTTGKKKAKAMQEVEANSQHKKEIEEAFKKKFKKPETKFALSEDFEKSTKMNSVKSFGTSKQESNLVHTNSFDYYFLF